MTPEIQRDPATASAVEPEISVVIPIFNEQPNLPQLFSRLTASLAACTPSYELVFVDDGSRDGSLDLIRRFQATDRRVRAISFSRNFGHQAALTAGIEHARGRAVILMDGDLQDPPEVLPELIARWREGFETVYTVKARRRERWSRRLLFWSFYRLIRLVSDIELPLDAGIFSLLDRRVVDALRSMPERNRYLSGLRAWSGFRQTAVMFERAARPDGAASRQTSGRLTKLALDGIFSFSHIPIRLVSVSGVFVSIVTFLGAMTIVGIKLFTTLAIPGWASIMVTVAFLGGVQLITVGIVGEYVGRIYDEVKQRPMFFVREVLEPDGLRLPCTADATGRPSRER
jgi:dolichol-phosphate mannosyltransferase